MQSHKHFWWVYTEGGYNNEPLFCLEFFTPVTCISRKRNEIRQKKQCSCSKIPFYYLTAKKTRCIFHNSEPLAPLRLKDT